MREMKYKKFKSVTEMAKSDISKYIIELKKDESTHYKNNKNFYKSRGKFSSKKYNSPDYGPNDCFLKGETLYQESYIYSTEMLFSKETKWLNKQLGIHSVNK